MRLARAFLVLVLFMLPSIVNAGYSFECTYTFQQTTTWRFLPEHWDYDRGTNAWILVPDSYYAEVSGTWVRNCQWVYVPDSYPLPDGR
jgi:hypothetical protein